MEIPTVSDAVAQIQSNPLTAVALASSVGLVTGGIIGGVIGASSSSGTKRKSRSRSGRSRDRKFISRQKHERAYVKKHGARGRKRYKTKRSKSSSRRGIHFTKNGQPYKILPSGKARFIKRSKR